MMSWPTEDEEGKVEDASEEKKEKKKKKVKEVQHEWNLLNKQKPIWWVVFRVWPWR